MSKWQYTKGLHDLGNGCFAYLQPDGSWGWSNAGLIVDHDQTLLVGGTSGTAMPLRTASSAQSDRSRVPSMCRCSSALGSPAANASAACS